MGAVKAKDVKQSDILRLESEMNNLWGELNTSNIPHSLRMELEKKLSDCEEQFKAVLEGQASTKQLEETLTSCDINLAEAVIQQAKNEIPKADHASSNYQALENIKRELKEKHLSPTKARHEVKDIMRHHLT